MFKVKARLLFQLLLFESENVLQKSLLLAAAAAAAAAVVGPRHLFVFLPELVACA